MKRDKTIRRIRREFNAWRDPRKYPLHLLMGQAVQKQDGYKLRRAGLQQSLLDAGLDCLDDLLNQSLDGKRDVDAVLSQWASMLLYKIAETEPPPLKWFPKELAMHAAVKLADLANQPEPRHKGTNRDDFTSRDYFIIVNVKHACDELGLKATKNVATAGDSGCSILAEALNLEEFAVNKVWGKRKQFGVL